MQRPSPSRGRPRRRTELETVLTPGSPFTHTELRAMEIDGVLQRMVAGAYVPASRSSTAELRATALGATLDDKMMRRTVVGRLSAAWIYGAAPPPQTPVLLVPAPYRVSATGRGFGILLHEVALGDFDVIALGPVRVTSPLRTAVDVAVHAEAKAALPVLRRLLSQPGLGLTVSLMSRALESLPRQPRKGRGREILKRLQPSTDSSIP